MHLRWSAVVLALAACRPVEITPAPHALRRLTVSQYEHAVRDLFGEDVILPPVPEPDLELNGLATLGAAVGTFSPRGVERFEAAAYAVAGQGLDEAHRARNVPCAPAATRDDACAAKALDALGRRAWRRPLTAAERDALVAIAGEAAETLGDFHQGLAYGVAGLLQSPDFLMRPTTCAGDGCDGERALTDWEIAERLAFFLWDGLPDDALLDAAAAGALHAPRDVEAQVQRMIADPRARRGLRAWVTDLLDLDHLDRLQKDPLVFVQMSDAVGPSAREETLRVWEHIVFDTNQDLRDVLTTRQTYVDRALAMIYKIPAPAREGFGAVELDPAGPRAGYFGQAGFLALHAHPTASSATLRGKFIRETLLCEPVPDPPAGVDTSIPEVSPDAPTRRDRVREHLESPSCSACHLLMDPIGLALENFDGVGAWRETENGARIDASGELDGVVFDGPLAMAEAVRAHPDFNPCLVRQVVRHAVGHDPGEGEQPALDALLDGFRQRGYRLRDLWTDLATSPVFLTVGAPEP